jgi:hypothetical protein
MPSLLEQLAIPGIFTAPFVVGRLMLPPGGDYEELETRYAPFDRLHRVDEPMRAGVVALAHRCDEEGRELSVLASNKVEGCAPLTLKGIAALLSSR